VRYSNDRFAEVAEPIPATALPVNVDWRNKSVISAVKDQGQCGSCWAFSFCGQIESHNFLLKNKTVECSPQALVDCSPTSYQTTACSGGWYQGANEYLKSVGGNPLESSYPYKDKQNACAVRAQDRVIKTGTGYAIKLGSEADLMNAVAFQGPVVTCVLVTSNFYSYSTGVFTYDQSTVGQHCNHAILIVGYGTLNGVNYWKVRNSWKASWGVENGHIRLPRNGVNYGSMLTYNFFANVV